MHVLAQTASTGEERAGLRRALLGWYAETGKPLRTVHVDRNGTRHAHEADVIRTPRGGFLLVGFAVGDMEPTVTLDDALPGRWDEGD